MQDLLTIIGDHIKEAMKEKDKERLNALRYLKSMLIENKTSETPRPEIDVVISLHKKLADSMTIYPEGHAEREKIAGELKYLAVYMPKAMTEEEVINLIDEIKSKLSSPNMGAIMKELSAHIKGRFDGKRATELVKERV